MWNSVAKVGLETEPHPPGNVLERLHCCLGATIGLMVALRRIDRRRPARPRLLDPRLKRQHVRLLVRLKVDVFLDAVNILNTSTNQVPRVALLGRTLALARVREQRLRLAIAHNQYCDAIAGFRIPTLHKAEIGANGRYRRGIAGH